MYEMGVSVLEVVLTVRDERGQPIDAAATSVEELVEVIRARPPSSEAGRRGERDFDVEVFGPAMLSLEAVERLSRQVAALRSACVAAVADETPGGAGSDQVLDEAVLRPGRLAPLGGTYPGQGRGPAPPTGGLGGPGPREVDLTRARILADALLEIPATDPDGVPREDFEAECAALLADGLAYAQDHPARRLELFLRRRLLALGCGERPRRRARGPAERGV